VFVDKRISCAALLKAGIVASLLLFSHAAMAEPNWKDAHYKLVTSKNDELCKPLTALYNRLLAEDIKERADEVLKAVPAYEVRRIESFVQAGFIELPSIMIRVTTPYPNKPSLYKHYLQQVYLADFFNEGIPRLVLYRQILSGGGRDEATQILIYKKGTQYNEDIFRDDAVEFDLPLEKERDLTERIYTWRGNPYIIENHHGAVRSDIPFGGYEFKLRVYTLTHKGSQTVCDISLVEE